MTHFLYGLACVAIGWFLRASQERRLELDWERLGAKLPDGRRGIRC